MVEGMAESRSERFPRSERLHLKREIDAVFAQGKKSFCFPYRAVYRITPAVGEEIGLAIAVVAPKRLYKRAVARNAQKRRLRELYRTQANALRSIAQTKGVRIAIMFLCVSKEAVPREKARKAIQHLLHDVQRAALNRQQS